MSRVTARQLFFNSPLELERSRVRFTKVGGLVECERKNYGEF
jgi:hypothetical protein